MTFPPRLGPPPWSPLSNRDRDSLPLLALTTMRHHLESGVEIWVVRAGAHILEIFGGVALFGTFSPRNLQRTSLGMIVIFKDNLYSNNAFSAKLVHE
jgi:hypothetical protein